MKISGAEALVKSLELENTEIVSFGYPGGAILSVYDSLYKSKNKAYFDAIRASCSSCS